MADNLFAPIDTINIGDEVIDAFGEKQEILNVLEYDIDEEIIELEFENGKIIKCTKDHEFLTTNRGWIKAENLNYEDDIQQI